MRRARSTATLSVLMVCLLWTAASTRPARAEEMHAPHARAVSIVQVPAPWWAPHFLIRSRFEASLPRYRAVPGLLRKFYILSPDGQLGGIYLWESRAAADAFYDDAWHADIQERYGQPANLLVFDSPAQLRAPAAPMNAEETGAPYVALAVPPAPGSGMRTGMKAAPDTQAPRGPEGVLHRYATASSDARSGIYLFADETAAEAFLTAAAAEPGAGSIDRFEVPVVLDNTIR